jgi:hypothetical protein
MIDLSVIWAHWGYLVYAADTLSDKIYFYPAVVTAEYSHQGGGQCDYCIIHYLSFVYLGRWVL